MTDNNTTKTDHIKPGVNVSLGNCKKNVIELESSVSPSIRAKLFWLAVSLCVLTLFSCTTGVAKIYPAYEGQRRPAGEVAKVFASPYIDAIIEIDGKETSLETDFWAGNPKVELLPGDHTVKVGFFDGSQHSLAFTVKAAHRYELTRWGNNAVLMLFIDRFNKPFVAPIPGPNDVIVRSPMGPGVGLDGMSLLSVDGKNRSSSRYGFAIRLAPGSHTFSLSFFDIGGFFQSTFGSKGSTRISGNLEAGHIYVVEPRIERKARRWSPRLIKDILRSAP